MCYLVFICDGGLFGNVLWVNWIDNVIDWFVVEYDGVVFVQEQCIVVGVDFFDFVQYGDECCIDVIYIVMYGGVSWIEYEFGVCIKVIQLVM